MGMAPCGRTWDDHRDSPLLEPEITFCPMHEQAKNMLAALEKALPILSRLVIEKGLEPGLVGYHSDGWVVKEAVREAVATARGGA